MHATHETAKQLQQAGFPQPQKNIGQFWYDTKGDLWAIGEYTQGTGHLTARCLSYTGWEWVRDTNGFIFAPTATDILRELHDVSIHWHGKYWFVELDNGQFGEENPAEAAALAWLDYQKRQKA